MVLAPGASSDEPNAAIFSPAMPTSPTNVPPGVTTVPPLTIVSSFMSALLAGSTALFAVSWCCLLPIELPREALASRGFHPAATSSSSQQTAWFRLRIRGGSPIWRSIAFDDVVPALILVPGRSANGRLRYHAVTTNAAEIVDRRPTIRRMLVHELIEPRQQPLDHVRP